MVVPLLLSGVNPEHSREMLGEVAVTATGVTVELKTVAGS
jgi:hypothetical protein